MDPAQGDQNSGKDWSNQTPDQTQPAPDIQVNPQPIQESQNASNAAGITAPENMQLPGPDNLQTPPTENPSTQEQPGTTQPLAPESVIPASQTPTIPKKKNGLKIFLILLIFLFLVTIGASGFAYAVAYEKIKLEKYPDLQEKVSFFVISLPFMPKTPKFLLERSAIAHQDVTKQSFDISMAIDSESFTSSLGLNQIDLQAKGAVDYSDPRNLKLITDVSITKDFNFELKKKDNMLYFKINKLPSFLFAFLGIKTGQFDSVIDKWVSYDTTPLDTEARRQIQEDKKVDPLSEQFLDENFSKYIDKKVLSKMNLSQVTEDGFEMYKITLSADADLIDYIGKKIEDETNKEGGAKLNKTEEENPEKLSDTIKKLDWEIYIDKKEYYTRKILITAEAEFDDTGYNSFILEPGSTSSQKQKMNIAFAAKSGNYGEEVTIDVPPSSMTFEEFTDALSEIMMTVYGGAFSELTASTEDSRRKSDLTLIKSGLEMYYADCGTYPTKLTDLSSKTQGCTFNGGPYLYSLPQDPDGSNYFYQVSTDKKSYDLCALLKQAETSQNSCPDSSYNYHIKNP